MEDSKPGPCIVTTGVNLPNIKKEFDISLSNSDNNNSKYKIIIEINNNLLLISLKKSDDITISYKKIYNLNEIKEISNVFSFHQDLSDVFEYLTGMLEIKTLHLKYDENIKNMYLLFYFEIPGTKKKEEIKLYFEKNILSQEEENEIIKKEIIYLRNEIKALKDENNALKKIIENKEKNNGNNNISKDNDIGNNLEEIINILIEEKLQNYNLINKNKNNDNNNVNNNNLNNENEIKNLNELISIKYEDNKEQFNDINNKIKNINFVIDEIKNNNKLIQEEIESMKTIVNNIHIMSQEENQSFCEKLNLLELKISDNETVQQQEIKNLQTIINEINNTSLEEMQSIRLIMDLNNSSNYNSGAPPKQNDINIFIKNIKNNMTDYKNKTIQIKLLYDARFDGGDVKICHNKCNNIQNTFSVITTTKEKKFGFFRSIAINGNGEWLKDNKAFFYSFDKNKIYKIKNDKSAVKFDQNFYINTVNFSLSGNILEDKYNLPDKNTMNLNFDGFNEEYEFTCGDKDFYVKNFEAFQLEIS